MMNIKKILYNKNQKKKPNVHNAETQYNNNGTNRLKIEY